MDDFPLKSIKTRKGVMNIPKCQISQTQTNRNDKKNGNKKKTHAFLNLQIRPNFSHCTHRG